MGMLTPIFATQAGDSLVITRWMADVLFRAVPEAAIKTGRAVHDFTQANPQAGQAIYLAGGIVGVGYLFWMLKHNGINPKAWGKSLIVKPALAIGGSVAFLMGAALLGDLGRNLLNNRHKENDDPSRLVAPADPQHYRP